VSPPTAAAQWLLHLSPHPPPPRPTRIEQGQRGAQLAMPDDVPHGRPAVEDVAVTQPHVQAHLGVRAVIRSCGVCVCLCEGESDSILLVASMLACRCKR
jgi:hypothetical protein